MNTFYEHHQDSIKLSYRCFDRILLNGLIQPYQQPERVIGFFNAYRSGQRVSRKLIRDIAEQFHPLGRCLSQSASLAANKLRDQGVDFKQHANTFLHCAQPKKLQQLADSLTPQDLLSWRPKRPIFHRKRTKARWLGVETKIPRMGFASPPAS